MRLREKAITDEWFLLLPFIARHDAMHKLVEERYCECCVSMVGTPDHALGDELIPDRPKGCHGAVES